MTFRESVRTCFSKWKTFDGRAARSEYWWFVLFVVAVSVILSIVDGLIFGFPPAQSNQNGPLESIFGLIVLLPGLAVLVRRLHDTGRSGWYALLPAALGVVFVLTMLIGVFSVALIAEKGSGAMPAIGMLAGGIGMVLYMIAALVVFVLMIYWLTKPGDPTANQYGPPPAR